jgi:hypothetical protein
MSGQAKFYEVRSCLGILGLVLVRTGSACLEHVRPDEVISGFLGPFVSG